MHRRAAHAEKYHAENIPRKSKPQWDEEELVILARAELENEGKSKINQILHAIMPSRPLEGIKKKRQTVTYKKLLADLREERTEEEQRREPKTPLHREHTGTSAAAELKEKVFRSKYLVVDPLQITSGVPDEATKLAIDNEYLASFPVSTRQKRSMGKRSPAGSTSRRRLRREQYAKIQRLYKKNRRECGRTVLAGKWRKVDEETSALDPKLAGDFWGKLLSEDSVQDQRSFHTDKTLEEILYPITEEELTRNIASMKNGAPGPDGVRLEEFKLISREVLLANYNLWLYAGYQPSQLREAVTVLIPKVERSSNPAEYRPISITNFTLRCLHKILASRLERTLPVHYRQRAFRSGDGVLINTQLLQTILADSKGKMKKLCLATLDISKAFDSVSHDSILVAARRLGMPELFITYLSELYKNCYTNIRLGEQTRRVHIRRGVRQGDPLSVHLFNAVMDMSLKTIDERIGYKLKNTTISALAFADDLVILAKTPIALQKQINSLVDELAMAGLKINAAKCRTLHIQVDGKAKRWVVNPCTKILAEGIPIKAISISEEIKYLGINFTPKGARTDIEAKYKNKLKELSEAPLKPQQRLYLLRSQVISSTLHELSLVGTTRKYLNYLDHVTRKNVKSWLRIPKDTPNAMITAPVGAGGLGVMSFRYRVPLIRYSRLTKQKDAADDEAAIELTTSAQYGKTIEKALRMLRMGQETITTKEALTRHLKTDLYKRVDGRGLRPSGNVSGIFSWVSDGTSMITGRNFIGAIKIRGNLMPTPVRNSRGRPSVEVQCDACGRPCSLGHVLQVCPRTHGPRIRRHDKIVRRLEELAARNNLETIWEPRIRTKAGLRKPDLIIINRDKNLSLAVDVSIVADSADLESEHNNKVNYYDNSEIRSWIKTRTKVDDVQVSALIFSWRGCVGLAGAEMMTRFLGATTKDIGMMSLTVCESGYSTWVDYNRSSYRIRRKN